MRRLFLWSFISFLSLTAVVAIFSVLNGRFNETDIKILVTTFSISAASICSMSCAAFIGKRGLVGPGAVGILAAGLALILVIFGAWSEVEKETYWKVTFTVIVTAAAFAHAFLLWIPVLSPAHRWTQVVAAILTAVVAVQVSATIWGEISSNDWFRGLAVTSILLALATLVIPICMKLRGNETVERLVLNKTPDGTYTDAAGRRYQVVEVGGNK